MTQKVRYQLPYPRAHIEPFGFLPDKPASVALWFFLVSAHHAIHHVPKQVRYNDEDDTTLNLNRLARSIAIAGNVELSEMFDSGLWRAAKAEAENSKLPIDERIIAFIESGGEKSALYTRNTDADSC